MRKTAQQKALDASVNALLKENNLVVRDTPNSKVATFVGNFLICKSSLNKFLLKLGYARSKRATEVGRLYFKVDNIEEIVTSLFYLQILYPSKIVELVSTGDPRDVIRFIVEDKLSITSPIKLYLQLRQKLYNDRLTSLGTTTEESIKEIRDTLWFNSLIKEHSSGSQIITSGEELNVSPAIIMLTLITADRAHDTEAKFYRQKNELIIRKNFLKHHYIRAFMDKTKKSPEELRDLLGYSHADVNAMATTYQDELLHLLNITKERQFIDV